MIKLLLTAPKQHWNASNNAAIPPATWSSYPPLFSSMRSLDPTPPTRVCRQWSPLKTQVWVHFPPTPLCLLVKTAGGQLSSVLLLRLAILERPCKQASPSVHFRQRLYQILRVHTIWLSNVNTRIKNMTDTRLKTQGCVARVEESRSIYHPMVALVSRFTAGVYQSLWPSGSIPTLLLC